MQRWKVVCAASLFGSAFVSFAQTGPAGSTSAFSAAIDAEITSQEKTFVDAVQAMPADEFDFSPESLNVSGSEFKGVRRFSAQVKHVAADNFAIWAPLTGKPEPAGLNAPNGPVSMISRSEIFQFLKDSFAFGHRAVKDLTAENAVGLVEFRGRKVTRISLIVLALTHVSDHYGQLAEYLRMSGVVPPASRPGPSPSATKPPGG